MLWNAFEPGSYFVRLAVNVGFKVIKPVLFEAELTFSLAFCIMPKLGCGPLQGGFRAAEPISALESGAQPCAELFPSR